MKSSYFLQLPQQTLECRLLYSARKTLAIEIKANGEVLIRAPKQAKDAQIIRFVESKKAWIAQKRLIALQRIPEQKSQFQLCCKQSYSCLGQKLLILGPEVTQSELQQLTGAGTMILRVKSSEPQQVQREAEKQLRQIALREFSHTAALYAPILQVSYQKITMKAQKTRWGSCSSKGNLNLNWKLLFLPPELSEYVVVHELAHLRVMNHSAQFWQVVAAVLPDYLKRKRQLSKISGNFLP
ncbi:MAG: M48 family metallopeptidase [Negativicutes bacterium]|nr:M48 family metallopeptidase [Negativicutes bacterium]